MSAFPLVHSFISFGSASWSRVGLERGKIMGRETWEAISVIISRVKALGFVEVPIRTWGFTALITERRSE